VSSPVSYKMPPHRTSAHDVNQERRGEVMEEQPTFKSLERDGWSERADGYDEYTARITNPGIAPLLAAAEVASGQRLLDVCCGTGLVAAAAAKAGASVIGLDLSDPMVATARAKGLPAEFHAGDAEALPFADATFDCIVCNFGLYHLPDPDRAIAEAARVLKPGGRYAFTTWCGPDVSPLFKIIPEAVRARGNPDVGLPPAPPPFRLADRDESNRVMRAAGFAAITFSDFTSLLECPLHNVIEFLARGTVRMTMVLRAQTPEARARIEQEIKERLSDYTDGGVLRLPMPALVVSGRLM
jgi:ubiquinone/menaquinone biosynthesis C-methylase UbiE